MATRDNITIPRTCQICGQLHLYSAASISCLQSHQQCSMSCHFSNQVYNSTLDAYLDLAFHLCAIRRANLRLPVGRRPARSEPEVTGHLSVPLDARYIVGVLRERAEDTGTAAAMTARAHDRWRFLDVSEETYRHTTSPTAADAIDDLLPIIDGWLNADRTNTLVLLLTRPPITIPVTSS